MDEGQHVLLSEKGNGETRWEKPTWLVVPADKLDARDKPMDLASLRKVARSAQILEG